MLIYFFRARVRFRLFITFCLVGLGLGLVVVKLRFTAKIFMVLHLTDTILCTMRPRMSTDLVPFRIYHGNGEIRYGDNGVDLGVF